MNTKQTPKYVKHMLKRTMILTCINCGKSFKYEMSDAVMPIDRDIIAQSLCNRCRRKAVTVKPGKWRGSGPF